MTDPTPVTEAGLADVLAAATPEAEPPRPPAPSVYGLIVDALTEVARRFVMGLPCWCNERTVHLPTCLKWRNYVAGVQREDAGRPDPVTGDES